MITAPWPGGSLVGVSPRTPKGCGFGPRSGRTPRLRVRFPSGVYTRGNQWMCLSQENVSHPVSPSLPLSKLSEQDLARGRSDACCGAAPTEVFPHTGPPLRFLPTVMSYPPPAALPARKQDTWAGPQRATFELAATALVFSPCGRLCSRSHLHSQDCLARGPQDGGESKKASSCPVHSRESDQLFSPKLVLMSYQFSFGFPVTVS